VLSETLAKGLQQYRIGEKLRILRLRKKMGLVELGQHSGLSAAMLSKIERGRLVPTLPTLLRIALVFSVGLDHFFGDPARPLAFAIVRKKDRQRFPERQGDTQPAYWFESLDFPAVDRRMSAYFVEFEELAAERVKRHHHTGAEMIYVLGGRLVLAINDAEHHLAAGDSVYFDSSAPHSYRRDGRQSCTALVVVTP
jgi:transcriptional regulator with XRE-family HTH domain